MNYTKSHIQDKNGNFGYGYIDENGRTFKDPQGKERIDVGTTVFTQGGPYLYTSSGGVKTPSGIYDDIKSASDKGLAQLSAMNDANQRAIKTRTNKQIAQIDDMKDEARGDYRNANRAAYRAYVEAMNPYGAMAEQHAKIGLDNSGYSESAKMRIGNTYQNAINNNALALNEYMNELKAARRDAIYDGDIDAANAISEYAQLVYKHGIDTAERLTNQANSAYATMLNRDNELWDQKMYLEDREYKREQDAKQAALNNAELSLKKSKDTWSRAIQLVNLGFSNDQIAKALGISRSELDRIQNKDSIDYEEIWE